MHLCEFFSLKLNFCFLFHFPVADNQWRASCDRFVQSSVWKKAINHKFCSSFGRIRIFSLMVNTGSNTLELFLVSVTTLANDSFQAWTGLSIMENLLAIENSRFWFCFDWIWSSSFSPSDSSLSCVGFISTSYPQKLQVYLITRVNPSEESKHFDPEFPASSVKFTILDQFRSDAHPCKKHHDQEGPWSHWLVHKVKVESYTLWGWKSGRMAHHKQISEQTVLRNQCCCRKKGK